MLIVETIGRIRRAHLWSGKSIRQIARDLKISRNTVRRILRSGETSFSYEREIQPRPKLGRWKAEIDRMLTKNAEASARERLTLIRLFEELRALGYEGGYDAVRRYAKAWSREHASQTASALRSAVVCAGRSLPVRLEPRDRGDGRRDDEFESRACPALPQPDDVRARLSARDPGNGVRRA
jgi:transposase